MRNQSSEKDKDHQELIAQSEIHADLIIILDYAKIGMTRDIVHSVIVVYISMIDPIIKQDGNNKKTIRNRKS